MCLYSLLARIANRNVEYCKVCMVEIQYIGPKEGGGALRTWKLPHANLNKCIILH